MAEVQYILSLKDLFSKKIQDADKATDKLEGSIGRVQTGLGSLARVAAGAFAVGGIVAFGNELVSVAVKVDGLRNSLNFIAGSAQGGAETFEYLKKTSQDMGLSFETAAQGFKTIAAAARGTTLEGKETREVFEGISMAGAVMGLTAEQSEGALLALGQMISKGKVQAEELRGQLGERIPSAFRIAAASMNMTTAQLDKFMSDGKLVAEDFLPRFAAQLKKEFSGGMTEASKSVAASINRMNTEWFLLKATLSEELKPVIIEGTRLLIEMMSWVKEGVGWIKEHSGAIKGFAAALATVLTGMIAYNSYLKLSVWWNGLSTAAIILNTLATEGLSAALVALRIAVFNIPIVGWVLAGIAALIGLFTWLSDRAGGLGNVFKALGRIIKGVFTLDWDEIKGGWDDLFNGAENAAKKAASAAGSGASAAGNMDFGLKGKGATTPGASMPNVAPSKSVSSAGSVQGSRPQNIYINITKLIETQQVKVENAGRDFVQKVGDVTAQALLNAVNDVNRIATN